MFLWVTISCFIFYFATFLFIYSSPWPNHKACCNSPVDCPVLPVYGFLISDKYCVHIFSLFKGLYLYFSVVRGSRLFLAVQWLPAWTLSSPGWIFGRGISFRASIMCGATKYEPALFSSRLLGALPCTAKRHSRVPQTAPGTKTCWKALTAQHQTGAYIFVCKSIAFCFGCPKSVFDFLPVVMYNSSKNIFL